MTKFYKILLILVVTITSMPYVVFADTQPPLPPYIQRLANGGAQIKYLGNDLGLQGWMAVKDAQRQYIYVTPNQEAYLLGILLDRDGDMVTKAQLERFVDKNPAYLQDQIKEMVEHNKKKPETTVATSSNNEAKIVKKQDSTKNVESVVKQTSNELSPSQELFAEIQESNWVEVGSSSAPIVYAFVDPECPHCHQFITDLRDAKAFDSGKIRTRLIPVGIMGKDSLYEAAKLIESSNPKKTFFDHIDGDEFALAVDESLNTQKVQENMGLMQDWNLDVTPFIIYESNSGEIKIIRGRPKKLDEFFNDIK